MMIDEKEGTTSNQRRGSNFYSFHWQGLLFIFLLFRVNVVELNKGIFCYLIFFWWGEY